MEGLPGVGAPLRLLGEGPDGVLAEKSKALQVRDGKLGLPIPLRDSSKRQSRLVTAPPCLVVRQLPWRVP
jgi:hypothetical protein